MSEVVEVVNDNLPDVSNGVFLLDFYGTVCGPCKMIAPFLKDIASERDDVTILKLDIDTNVELTKQYNIRSIPALFVLKDGVIKASKVGGSTKDNISKLIDSVVL